MRSKIEQYVKDMDAKYRRVPLNNAVELSPDSTDDFYREVIRIIEKTPNGKYETLCVHFPDPSDFVDPNVDDSELDRLCDECDEIITQLTEAHGWVIPEGDDEYDPDHLSLVFG